MSEWGRSDLTQVERLRVLEANLFMTKVLALCEAARRLGGAYVLEHPADPGEDPVPSIFATAFFQQFLLRTNGVLQLSHQCMYGGQTQKTTGLAHCFPALEKGALVCSGDHSHRPSRGREGAGTSCLRTYPAAMCRWLAWAILVWAGDRASHDELAEQKVASRRHVWGWASARADEVAFNSLNKKIVEGGTAVISINRPAIYLHVGDGVVATTAKQTSLGEKRLPRRAKWWPSVRRELTAMAALVPAAVAEIGALTLPTLFASNAEGANAND